MAIQGIIRPPPDIRAVADKTASFVAKNGRGFETRIMSSAKGKTPKFSFLHESSPFHAYYEDRIVFYANGGVDEKKEEEKKVESDEQAEKKASDDAGTDASGETSKEGQAKTEVIAKGKETLTARKTKSIVDPVARALLAQRSRIKKALDPAEDANQSKDEHNKKESKEEQPEKETLIPPRQKYTVLVPPKNITHAQLEIIKLTAQFVALNGKGGSFLRELTVREWNSPSWGFLQPRHAHYAYFTQLVDLYRRLLQEAVLIHEVETKKRTKENDEPQSSLLELVTLKKMAGIDIAVEEKGEVKDQVQLIANTAGDVSKCLEYAAFNAEYERYYEEKRRRELESTEGSGGIAGTARIDWHDFVVVETIEFAVDEIVQSLPPPPPPAPKREEPAAAAKVADDEVMDESSDDEGGEKIQVVENYAPKVVSSKAQFTSEARTHVIDPITKKSIRIDDMTEHMRIQLLDPKWAAEKAKFLDKQKDSNLVGGDAIAKNMETFAKARTDLFGSSELENIEESRRRLEASREAHVQPQMPQPRPIASMASSAVPISNHLRPEAAPPDAKRQRTETMQAPNRQTGASYVQTGAPPLLPVVALAIPPPTGIPMTAAPPALEPPPETDTVELPTTLSEADFMNSLPDPNILINIQVPDDPSQDSWNLKGQTISITVNGMVKVKAIKQQIKSQLGSMPVNKMQLKNSTLGFLKDSVSLAYLNIGPNDNSLELIPKVRGGRR